MLYIGLAKQQMMSANKESQLLQSLKTYLLSDDIKIGDRLASERKLAEKFGSSRNSIRNAIKMLQAKGILDVQPNSGYYLKNKSDLEGLLISKDQNEEKYWITDQLEVFYLFEPQAVMLSAARMNKNQINTLEACLVQLSKAMLENNSLEIVNNHKKFHEIIARGTGNKAIAQMMQRLELTYELIADIFQKISQEERQHIFALHVNLFKSISTRNKQKSFNISREMILSFSVLLNHFEGINLPESIKEELNSTKQKI